MEEQAYVCSVCRKELTVPQGAAAPRHCGKPMEAVPLPYCEKPPVNPESARLADEDEPCNDGIVKQKK